MKSCALEAVVWVCAVTLLLNEKTKKINESVLKHFQTNLFTFLFSHHSSNCPRVSVKLTERNILLCILSPSFLSIISLFLLPISRLVSSFSFFPYVLPELCSVAQFFLPEMPKHFSSFCLYPFCLSFSLSALYSVCVKLFPPHPTPISRDGKGSHPFFLREHLKKILFSELQGGESLERLVVICWGTKNPPKTISHFSQRQKILSQQY